MLFQKLPYDSLLRCAIYWPSSAFFHSTYIPWSVYETQPGVYDFGEEDERKDLEAFFSLCEKKGLWVIVRPGPHINAEMTLFGYPEWILADEEIQARTPQGTSVVYPYVTKQFECPLTRAGNYTGKQKSIFVCCGLF